MTDYRVTYFDMAASRGEEVRLALVIAGIAFDDNRLPRGAFAEIKSDMPFLAVPVLDIAGHGTFAQTNAILRLIGRQSGLYPDDMFEAARHDALMDAVEDFRHKISPTGRIADPEQRKAARHELAADYIPQWGRCVDKLIGDGPFLAGEHINVADIKLYMADRWISSGILDDIPPAALDGSPKLKALASAVRNHPPVVAWYESSA